MLPSSSGVASRTWPLDWATSDDVSGTDPHEVAARRKVGDEPGVRGCAKRAAVPEDLEGRSFVRWPRDEVLSVLLADPARQVQRLVSSRSLGGGVRHLSTAAVTNAGEASDLAALASNDHVVASGVALVVERRVSANVL